MGKKKKSKKVKSNNVEVLTEEQYEEYVEELYGMDFIAGFTENGVPFGTFIDEVEENEEKINRDILNDPDEELPF